MILSVLLPTRERAHLVEKVIHNLNDTCSGENEFEILLKIDDDDQSTIDYVETNHVDSDFVRWIITPKGNGYHDMHHWVNDLCNIAKGTFLFLYNDDCIMETKNWDKEFKKHENKICVLKPFTLDKYKYSNLFPAMHKKIFELWGHFSLNPHNDTWVENISREGHFEIPIDVEIIHDRADITGNNNDAIYANRSLAYRVTQGKFYGDEMRAARNKDKRIIVNFIKENCRETTD